MSTYIHDDRYWQAFKQERSFSTLLNLHCIGRYAYENQLCFRAISNQRYKITAQWFGWVLQDTMCAWAFFCLHAFAFHNSFFLIIASYMALNSEKAMLTNTSSAILSDFSRCVLDVSLCVNIPRDMRSFSQPNNNKADLIKPACPMLTDDH